MSDRMYLAACPAADIDKFREWLDTPSHFPPESYVEDGILYTPGRERPNPRHRELSDWVWSLPDIYLVKWPRRHMSSLFWKLHGRETFCLNQMVDFSPMIGATSPACPAATLAPLLRKHVERAMRCHECSSDALATVDPFLAEHAEDFLFLFVS